MKYYILILALFLTLKAKSQIEIPDSIGNCKLMAKGNYSYCVDPSTYKPQWIAARMYKSDIEGKIYLPPDVEFFPELAEAGSIVWSKAEKQAMMWAMEFDSLYVVTGKVTIPGDSARKPATIMYKAILKGCQGDAIGFIVDPYKDKAPLREYAVPIDQIEALTGMDFFPKLHKELQDIIEPEYNPDFWPFSFE